MYFSIINLFQLFIWSRKSLLNIHLYKYFRTSTSFLIILVNDVNDHAPQFTATLYTAVLDEAAVIGTFVAAPLAVDQDTGVNSNIYYR